MTIVIVGGGKMGMSHLATATQYVGKSNVALCDTSFATRILFKLLGFRTFSSLNAAANKVSSIRGLIIATPTSSHAALVTWAILHKVPFFVEKPFTLNVQVSDDLVTAARASGVQGQLGFVMRYVASFQRLRTLVAEGCLGAVKGYTASMRGNVVTRPPAPGSWQGTFARGGGCLNEYGPHLIDLARFVFGGVRGVELVEISRVHSFDADDRVRIQWIHENSTPGGLEIDWCDSSKRKSVIEFCVQFEHADVRVDNSVVQINWHVAAPHSIDERARLDEPVQPADVHYYLRGEEFSLEIEDFLLNLAGVEVRSGNRNFTQSATASLEDGCEVDRLIEQIARKGGLK